MFSNAALVSGAAAASVRLSNLATPSPLVAPPPTGWSLATSAMTTTTASITTLPPSLHSTLILTALRLTAILFLLRFTLAMFLAFRGVRWPRLTAAAGSFLFSWELARCLVWAVYGRTATPDTVLASTVVLPAGGVVIGALLSMLVMMYPRVLTPYALGGLVSASVILCLRNALLFLPVNMLDRVLPLPILVFLALSVTLIAYLASTSTMIFANVLFALSMIVTPWLRLGVAWTRHRRLPLAGWIWFGFVATSLWMAVIAALGVWMQQREVRRMREAEAQLCGGGGDMDWARAMEKAPRLLYTR